MWIQRSGSESRGCGWDTIMPASTAAGRCARSGRTGGVPGLGRPGLRDMRGLAVSGDTKATPKIYRVASVTRPGISVREIPARASTFQTPRMIDTSVIRERFTAVGQDLNERSRRLLAAAEVAAASRATGVARSTIGRGLKDLADPGSLSGEVRRPGGGCPTLIAEDPTLLENLRQLLESTTMGDPMRPLMWVNTRGRA